MVFLPVNLMTKINPPDAPFVLSLIMSPLAGEAEPFNWSRECSDYSELRSQALSLTCCRGSLKVSIKDSKERVLASWNKEDKLWRERSDLKCKCTTKRHEDPCFYAGTIRG